MTERIDVVLNNKEEHLSGVISFDGHVIEIFGFQNKEPERIHIRQVNSVELSFKSGMLSMPMLRILPHLGSWGLTQGFEPDANERMELEKLAAAIEAAASKNPDWTGGR